MSLGVGDEPTGNEEAGSLAEPQKTRSEGPVVAFGHIDLAEVVRESVAEASRASPAVVVEVSTPPSLAAVAEGDALRGVVRLLVDNACRQSDAGVTVKAKRGDEGITVHVIDRGPGIDREQVAAAFSEPVRIEDVCNQERSLVGLNLSRSLVGIHGGILSAEPLPAGGTRVSFTIPEEPPALEGPDLQSATEALRVLAELEAMPLASAVAVLEAPVEQQDLLEEAQEEAARALELAVLADLASAEAPAGVEALTAPPEAPEEPAALEDVVELEPVPISVVDLQTDPEPEESVPHLGNGHAEHEPEMTPFEPEAVTYEPEPSVEVEVVPPLPDHVPDPVSLAAQVEEVESEKTWKPAQAEMPPRPFIPDPLDPATQMLRGLALDFDPDADGAPRWYHG